MRIVNSLDILKSKWKNSSSIKLQKGTCILFDYIHVMYWVGISNPLENLKIKTKMLLPLL